LHDLVFGVMAHGIVRAAEHLPVPDPEITRT
jgi:hypothetical protein